MRCEEIQEMLPGHAREGDASLIVRRHLAHCKTCGAEAERYSLLGSQLKGLASQTTQPPVHLYRALVDIPTSLSRQEQVKTHLARNKKAYAGGAAVVVGAVGAALWRSRARSHATA